MKETIACLLSAIAAFCLIGCGEKKGDPPVIKTPFEQLQEATGKTTVELTEDLTIEVEDETSVTFGGYGVDEIVLDGRNKGTKVQFTGSGKYALCAAYDGTLVFKNMTFEDYTGSDWGLTGGWRQGYFELSGKVRFENCNIKASLFLCAGSETEFKNCEFTSLAENMYSVWAAGKTVKMDGCTFKGFRGLKIHEQPEYDLLIERVDLTDCEFLNLTKKPGLAIGNIELDDEPTEIYLDGCLFENCQPWDKDGSYEGIDGFYEADTASGDFVFIWTDTTVDGWDAENLEVEYE